MDNGNGTLVYVNECEHTKHSQHTEHTKTHLIIHFKAQFYSAVNISLKESNITTSGKRGISKYMLKKNNT